MLEIKIAHRAVRFPEPHATRILLATLVLPLLVAGILWWIWSP